MCGLFGIPTYMYTGVERCVYINNVFLFTERNTSVIQPLTMYETAIYKQIVIYKSKDLHKLRILQFPICSDALYEILLTT